MTDESFHPRELWARPFLYATCMLLAGHIGHFLNSNILGGVALATAPGLLALDYIFRLYARSLRWFVLNTAFLFGITAVAPFALLTRLEYSMAQLAADLLGIFGWVACVCYYRYALNDKILLEFEQGRRGT